MFTTPAPSAPTVSATPVSPSSPSPRTSGLRGGLSFLRNYTHGLHSSHSAGTAGGPREDARPTASQTSRSLQRPRAATATTATAATPPIEPPSSEPAPAALPLNRLARTRTAPDSALLNNNSLHHHTDAVTMTRVRSETTTPQLSVRNPTGPTPAATPSTQSQSAAAMDTPDPHSGDPAMKHLPSIRFIPHQDPRAGRPSLQFPTITRTLPDESAIIRVGRYSERDNLPDIPPNVPSAAAVGFKSKVVSRKHCELWCKDGSWFIKDVKSSSGTFLNHIRLSQPNVESKPFRLKDGDIIQLGIDFRGGEEMIFRCVKIRVECNRGWQQALNTFNKQTHQRLRNLAKSKKEGDTASTHTSECSICLMSIAPCQSLFVAPCSHVWHYKCIRPILNGPTWPNFLCPNCRAVADLEADVEDPGEFEEWDEEVAQVNGESQEHGESSQGDRHVTPRASAIALPDPSGQTGTTMFADLEAAISTMDINASTPNGAAAAASPEQPAIAATADPETPDRQITPPSSSVTHAVSINVNAANERAGLSPMFPTAVNGRSPERVPGPECPMTPRNDVGPFVLDGSAGRASGARLHDEADSQHSDSTSGSTGAITDAPTLPPLRMD